MVEEKDTSGLTNSAISLAPAQYCCLCRQTQREHARLPDRGFLPMYTKGSSEIVLPLIFSGFQILQNNSRGLRNLTLLTVCWVARNNDTPVSTNTRPTVCPRERALVQNAQRASAFDHPSIGQRIGDSNMLSLPWLGRDSWGCVSWAHTPLNFFRISASSLKVHVTDWAEVHLLVYLGLV